MFNNLCYYIRTIYRWLLRCKYSLGFGIQSPSAYSFVCNVINNHARYDEYVSLNEDFCHRSLSFRKHGRLFFRLARFWQPFYVVMGDYEYASFVNEGCPDTLIRMIDDYYFDEEGQRSLIILDIDWLEDETIREEILDNVTDQDLLVLLNIHDTSSHRHLWHRIFEDIRCGVSYDLYSCGIIFFDKSKYKQHFKINF